MLNRKFLLRGLTLSLVFLFVVATTPGQQRTIRVAVLDFSMPQHIRDLHEIAPTLNQILITKIENSLNSLGTYQLVERTKIEAILREQQLIRNGVIDPQTAARLQRVYGVDALIYGSVDDYIVLGARDNRQYSVDELSVKARVSFKMVNTTTAAILVTGEAEGVGSPAPPEANKIQDTTKKVETGAAVTNIACRILNNCPRTVRRGSETMSPKRQTVDRRELLEVCKSLNDAAVADMVSQIVERIQTKKADEVKQIRTITKNLNGKVVEVDGEMLYITGIPASAVMVGDKLVVKRKTVNQTAKVSYFKNVGEVEILELQETVIIGRFSTANPTMKPAANDQVSNQ